MQCSRRPGELGFTGVLHVSEGDVQSVAFLSESTDLSLVLSLEFLKVPLRLTLALEPTHHLLQSHHQHHTITTTSSRRLLLVVTND